MDLDYYTISQAAERLECSEEDLFYHIENGHLSPSVYVKSKSLIIVEEIADKRIARAIVRYSGLLKIDPSVIEIIVESNSCNAGGVHTLLNPNKIKGWASECCYRSKDYQKTRRIDDWIGMDRSQFESRDTLLCMDVYQEVRSPEFIAYDQGIREKVVHSQDDKLREIVTTEPLNLDNSQEFSYQINDSNIYSLIDFRITHIDLIKFKKNSINFKPNNSPTPRRATGFTNLLREIAINCDFNRNKVLGIIKKELGSKKREYDKDSILLEMDDKEIIWMTEKNAPSTIKISSLKTRLSEIKKDYISQI